MPSLKKCLLSFVALFLTLGFCLPVQAASLGSLPNLSLFRSKLHLINPTGNGQTVNGSNLSTNVSRGPKSNQSLAGLNSSFLKSKFPNLNQFILNNNKISNQLSSPIQNIKPNNSINTLSKTGSLQNLDLSSLNKLLNSFHLKK